MTNISKNLPCAPIRFYLFNLKVTQRFALEQLDVLLEQQGVLLLPQATLIVTLPPYLRLRDTSDAATVSLHLQDIQSK